MKEREKIRWRGKVAKKYGRRPPVATPRQRRQHTHTRSRERERETANIHTRKQIPQKQKQ